MAKRRTNIKDASGTIDALIAEITRSGSARLVHLGLFRVVELKGKKRFDFKARKVVEMKPYKQIIFTPSKSIREMLRDGKMAADAGRARRN